MGIVLSLRHANTSSLLLNIVILLARYLISFTFFSILLILVQFLSIYYWCSSSKCSTAEVRQIAGISTGWSGLISAVGVMWYYRLPPFLTRGISSGWDRDQASRPSLIPSVEKLLSPGEVEEVQYMLCRKIPVEVADLILDEALYRPSFVLTRVGPCHFGGSFWSVEQIVLLSEPIEIPDSTSPKTNYRFDAVKFSFQTSDVIRIDGCSSYFEAVIVRHRPQKSDHYGLSIEEVADSQGKHRWRLSDLAPIISAGRSAVSHTWHRTSGGPASLLKPGDRLAIMTRTSNLPTIEHVYNFRIDIQLLYSEVHPDHSLVSTGETCTI